MDELKQGFQNDLSKTFDADETFDKVPHKCSKERDPILLSVGSRCPYCEEVIKKGE